MLAKVTRRRSIPECADHDHVLFGHGKMLQRRPRVLLELSFTSRKKDRQRRGHDSWRITAVLGPFEEIIKKGCQANPTPHTQPQIAQHGILFLQHPGPARRVPRKNRSKKRSTRSRFSEVKQGHSFQNLPREPLLVFSRSAPSCRGSSRLRLWSISTFYQSLPRHGCSSI